MYLGFRYRRAQEKGREGGRKGEEEEVDAEEDDEEGRRCCHRAALSEPSPLTCPCHHGGKRERPTGEGSEKRSIVNEKLKFCIYLVGWIWMRSQRS